MKYFDYDGINIVNNILVINPQKNLLILYKLLNIQLL
jgi:hypothetical protein